MNVNAPHGLDSIDPELFRDLAAGPGPPYSTATSAGKRLGELIKRLVIAHGYQHQNRHQNRPRHGSAIDTGDGAVEENHGRTNQTTNHPRTTNDR